LENFEKQLFVYQGQKMSKFEFSGRGAAEASKPTRKKGTFLSDLTNYKAKDIIGKITNLFCIYNREQ
jgi:hypothetical protein